MDRISIESFEPDVFNLTIPGYLRITLNRKQVEELKKEVDLLLAITINDLEGNDFEDRSLNP